MGTFILMSARLYFQCFDVQHAILGPYGDMQEGTSISEYFKLKYDEALKLLGVVVCF